MSKVYLIGSLREPRVHDVAMAMRAKGYEVFDDWRSPGPEADEHWESYEKARGRTYIEALYDSHAENVFEYDQKHLAAADAVVLVLPAGKSAHLELGWAVGKGKPSYILMNGEPERYDIMYRFATKVVMTLDELLEELPGSTNISPALPVSTPGVWQREGDGRNDVCGSCYYKRMYHYPGGVLASSGICLSFTDAYPAFLKEYQAATREDNYRRQPTVWDFPPSYPSS